MPYRTLNPDKIIETAETLQRRISERFPGSGLSGVCRELVDVARASKQRIVAVSRPNWALRVGIALILILGIGLLGYVATIIEIKRGTENLFGVLEGIENITQGVGIDVKPYVKMAPRHDATGDSVDLDAGADIFYKLTPSMTLTLTFNTDFAETEVDERLVNLTRFPLFFPEQRDFFLYYIFKFVCI